MQHEELCETLRELAVSTALTDLGVSTALLAVRVAIENNRTKQLGELAAEFMEPILAAKSQRDAELN